MQKIEMVRIGLFIGSTPSSTCIFTTWVASASASSSTASMGAGRRAWSEMRSSNAIRTQLATSDEPPYDRNGVVSPVSGISRVTPPMTTKTCSATTLPRPTAISLPKPSRQISEARSARSTIRPYSTITAITPVRPSSSPSAPMMKSDSARGMRCGMPRPRPRPSRPPQPIPNIDSTSW